MRQSHSNEPSPVTKPVSKLLLRWFARHKRVLPWRTEPRDPYHVWLSEIMLQQTQVLTVIPYYTRWLERFPTLASLASASLDDVLKMWEGLGYYSRARNLHRAAQVVMQDYHGQIPSTAEDLRKLPGVGRYTAGAIASLAYHQDAPILDGNVVRVLTRVYAIAGNVKDKATLDRLWQISASLLPHGRAGEFNEALMDLGATICTPRAPACTKCPLSSICSAYAKGTPEAFPIKIAKPPLPVKEFLTAVIFDANGLVLLAQRPAHGLLGGLWEFPSAEAAPTSEEQVESADAATQLSHIIRKRTGLRVNVREQDFVGLVQHSFSHFHMLRQVAIIHTRRTTPETRGDGGYLVLRWVTPGELGKLALARSDQKIAQQAFSAQGAQRQ